MFLIAAAGVPSHCLSFSETNQKSRIHLRKTDKLQKVKQEYKVFCDFDVIFCVQKDQNVRKNRGLATEV